jgi:glucokinase
VTLIALGTGIGAGIILNGALYRGAHESAGEVGYVIPAREFLRQRYDGFGALENVASGSGIADRARQLLKDRLTSAELASMNAEIFKQPKECLQLCATTGRIGQAQ